jgi:phosphoglycerate dehydrogenase-like enzyme
MRWIALVLFALGASQSLSAGPTGIERVISDYGLRESQEPVTKRPNWRSPTRIVVDGGVPGLVAALAEVAPGVTIVTARSITEMVAAVPGADAAIGRTAFICNDAVLAAGRDLRWLQTIYAGVELCMGKPALIERNVLLTNMRAIGGPVIAEHAIGMLFALTRGLHASIPRQAAGEWLEDYPAGTRLTTLQGKTMLVVGLGGIGTEVAKRADALGMRVVATRATPQPPPSFVRYVGRPEELAALIADADVVVNTAPLTPATRGLFDAKMFARMKPSAYFINVARGGAVVTADLVAALESHRLAGAGLDVTDPEPLPKDHPLWRAPNLVLTPHVAGQSDAGIEPQLLVLTENLRRYVAGERMLSVVDLQREY